jgi:D-amino-acid oxidase
MELRVVGAGIIGLTCALRLVEAGHSVEIVAAQPPEQTTSSVAAALWYPYRAYPEAVVTRWSAETYRVLSDLSSDPATGIRLQLGRELFRTPTADPWWQSAVPDLRRVRDGDLPVGYVDGYELIAPVIDMSRHLEWLVAQLHVRRTAVIGQRINRLRDAFGGVDAVINCAGLGSRMLADDRTLRPVRGQVIVVEQCGLADWVLDQSDATKPTYVVPRIHTVILGGTAEDGDEDQTIRPETTQAILRRCAALVPELAYPRIIRARVGLRPARPTVRLETVDTKEGPVVHCYGHGGAGVTVSYGCAREVVERVAELAGTSAP